MVHIQNQLIIIPQIRRASDNKLYLITGAYDRARAFMQANGNTTQWPDGYPGRIDTEEDIARGHCFLVANDEGSLAVFSFAPGLDATYAEIEGAWHSDTDYHIIHRVASVRGHGVARAIFTFAAERADYLRCDTHEDNAPIRRALRSFGFRECGTITVANGTQRVAYDWLKEPLDGGAPASPTTR